MALEFEKEIIKRKQTANSTNLTCVHTETNSHYIFMSHPSCVSLLCVAGSVEVSRRSPVASWLCAMLYCFGSYILADIMLGSSPIDYFQHNSHILLASAVWWEKIPQNDEVALHGRGDFVLRSHVVTNLPTIVWVNSIQNSIRLVIYIIWLLV